jgi:flagellar basal-body rod modification protein FlgD
LNLDGFLKLMVAELQNQDPLSPMENTEILQQISQIREIEATDKLGSTLDAVLLGQQLVSASTMIGKTISADVLDQTSEGIGVKRISGVVDRVALDNGEPKLFIGSQSITMDQVREISLPDDEAAATQATSATGAT